MSRWLPAVVRSRRPGPRRLRTRSPLADPSPRRAYRPYFTRVRAGGWLKTAHPTCAESVPMSRPSTSTGAHPCRRWRGGSRPWRSLRARSRSSAQRPAGRRGAIQWHGCGPEFPSSVQCGELSVPLDYSHPHGAKITLGFNRLRAQDRAHRVGSLIVNPGGPGGAGSEVVALEAAGRAPVASGVARALRSDRHGPARDRAEHADPVRPCRLQPAGVAVPAHRGGVRPADGLGQRVRRELPAG